jgi:hypothetical protein
MSLSEAELIAARIERARALIVDLEKACAAHANEREKFAALKAELDAARAALVSVQTNSDRW